MESVGVTLRGTHKILNCTPRRAQHDRGGVVWHLAFGLRIYPDKVKFVPPGVVSERTEYEKFEGSGRT